MWGRRPTAWVIAGLVLAGLAACGGNPPQIVDYSPDRGAIDVSTVAPVRITFDHDVDQASVESRLHLVPEVAGSIHWLNPRQLTYEHPTLTPNTSYQVVLEAGYKDRMGNAYVLRHHWSFITEGSPHLAGSTPASADGDVDPAAYLSLEFTRAMNEASLQGAITVTPSVLFSVRLDPADPRRAIIVPAQLLEPSTTYAIAVTTAALDVDGNQLDRDQRVVFVTGAVRPLRHWVAFETGAAGGGAGALWIVNESGFPRQLFGGGPVLAFSWSPEGDRLLIQGSGESWSALTPGEAPMLLPFQAAWAGALVSGMGYVYLDDSGALHRALPGGTDDLIATGVSQAIVAPGGERVAFVKETETTSTLWGYDVGLRSRYLLAHETAPISDLAWAPAGDRVAYLRHDVGAVSLRVRNLAGPATTATVATGDIGPAAWMPDSVGLLFAAGVQLGGGIVHKAFVVSAVAPPAALTPALGLPADPAIGVASPVPSPDGHQIAFVSSDQVWLMNGDGTRPTPLTRFDPDAFPYSCRLPAWTRA